MANGSFLGKASWQHWFARDLVLFAVLGTTTVSSTTVSSWSPSLEQSPDNTQANRPGASPDATRADQQGQSAKDRELARKIRRAVVTDKSLSTYAHNVKIIARDGVVTLKGPVRSDEEKNAIDARATEIAGASNVKDEMIVKPKS